MSKPTGAADDAEQILSKCRGLSHRVATFANRLTGESDAIAVEVNSLEQALKKAEAVAKAAKDEATLEQIREARGVIRGMGPGGDLRKYMKPKVPFMLRMVLGTKVNVIAHRLDQATALKEEYYRFRDSCALIMLISSGLLAIGMARAQVLKDTGVEGYTFAPTLMTGLQLYLTWLCYFYVALALRENVLMMNGSHIKGWWIRHHYFSSACTLIMLGLPVYSPAVFFLCQRFMAWSSMQAAVMMVQNHYQRRRMYTRIALGKNTAMDVVAGESSGGSGQLLILYPLLFVLQIWQASLGVAVAVRMFPSFLELEGWLEVESVGSDLRGARGVCLVGIVFAYMAVNNFITTVATLMEKQRWKKPGASAGARPGGSMRVSFDGVAGAATGKSKPKSK
ncbi:hypothetical protein FOA52_014936 [Chlamydomonas sp. UWO 241]|nr:hypothetical protein FOA52_014936 [Chlamydomonas sp. UWO 241]